MNTKKKTTENKFTPAYKAHLAEINKAQSAFDKDMNTNTATKLSNLKNNMFKNPYQVFTTEYIKKKINKAVEGHEEHDRVITDLKIVYKPGLYNHIADRLRVIVSIPK